MPTTQYVMTFGDDEEEITRRHLFLKDEFLLRTPGFREDQDETRRRMRPHDSEENRLHNVEVAKGFAEKWELPFTPDLGRDPSYLLDRPFSKAPMIVGSWFSLLQFERTTLPVIDLIVDVRMPESELIKRFKSVVKRAREEWKGMDGELFTSKNVARHSTADHLGVLLEILDKDDGEMTNESLESRLTLRHDIANVSRWRKEARRFVRDRKYREILPSSHVVAFTDLMRRIHAPLPKGRPVRLRP